MDAPDTLDRLAPLIRGLLPDPFPRLGNSTMPCKAQASYTVLLQKV